MKRNIFIMLGLIAALSVSNPVSALASQSLTVENCGAYLFEWRPVDCGNGQAFAILVGGNTIAERDVILNRGYDYAYTFNPNTYPRPWGQVPDLVNIDGVWGIPENWGILPEGAQPTTRMVLFTNNKNLDSNERYVDIVHLPNGTDAGSLPPEVRKYLINVDGSDAGAYNGTVTSGWYQDDDGWRYRQIDGTFVTNSWVKADGESYYMNENGIMLSDTVTPDGFYVNAKGEKQSYMPGWVQKDGLWKYVQKNGYYAASAWVQDADGNWYYFDMAGKILTDRITPDGFYVDANGVWDGQPSSINTQTNPGPGGVAANTPSASSEGTWEESEGTWKYKVSDGNYITSAWIQDTDGKWYYFNDASLMVTDTTTPDGYYVDANGVWNGQDSISR